MLFLLDVRLRLPGVLRQDGRVDASKATFVAVLEDLLDGPVEQGLRLGRGARIRSPQPLEEVHVGERHRGGLLRGCRIQRARPRAAQRVIDACATGMAYLSEVVAGPLQIQ